MTLNIRLQRYEIRFKLPNFIGLNCTFPDIFLQGFLADFKNKYYLCK